MDKAYNKIVFVNNQEPDLDATNMNAISNAIDEIDNRVIALNETVEQDSEVIAQHTEAIAQNTEDIEALKRKPSGITLTSASPLLNSAAAGIAGLSARGKSKQHISKNIINPKNFVLNAPYHLADGNTTNTANIGVQTIPIGGNLEMCVALTKNTAQYYRIACLDSNKNMINRFAETALIKNFTTASNCAFLEVAVDEVLYNGSVGYISIAKGSNVPYEPYTGTPTPTNPIPIKDASGVVEAHTKNLFDKNDASLQLNNVYIATDGTASSGENNFAVILKCEPNTNYAFRSPHLVSNNSRVALFTDIPKVGSKGTVVLTLPTNSIYEGAVYSGNNNYILFAFNHSGIGYQTFINDLQIEYGTTASEYVAYATNEINLSSIGIDLRSIPNTNIADTLTVKPDGSAEWVQKVDIADLSTLNWTKAANYWYSEDIAAIAKKRPIGSVVADIVCSTLTPAPSNQIASVGLGTDKIDIYYNNGDIIATPTDSPTGILYFELATPIVHQLTKEQVAAILALQTYAGTTIVESELDDVVVDYVGDTKGYIDSKFEYLYELIRSYHPEAQMMSLEDEPTAEEEESENV